MGVSSATTASAFSGLADTGVEVLSASEIGNEAETGVIGAVVVVIGVVGGTVTPVSVAEEAGAALVSMRLVTEAEAPRVPP